MLDTAISGIAAQRAIERAVYSDSMVDVAMDTCNLEHHTTKHPMTSMIYPVLDLTKSGLMPCRVPHPHAKTAPTTNTSVGPWLQLGPCLAFPLSSNQFVIMPVHATSWAHAHIVQLEILQR